MIRLLGYLPLLLAACNDAPAPAPANTTLAGAQDALQDALAEYQKAEQAYVKKTDAAGRGAHPAVAFYPRFEALAAQGHSRAHLWLAKLEIAAHPERSLADSKRAVLERHQLIATQHANEAWIRDWARMTSALYIDHGAAAVDPLVDSVIAACKDRETVGELLFRAKIEAERDKRAERAKALSAKLTKDYADTTFGQRAAGPQPDTAPPGAAPKGGVGLAIGQTAPDFTTKDTDGIEFKLSDYRGKVVVVDFWGFW